jgi:cation:H+ antiporter
MMLGVPPTLVAAVVFVVGVVLVVESVETFVESIAEAALGVGVSAFFLTVLLAGTDLENAILGLAAVTGDLPNVALGTVFGEALFILGAAVGVAGLLRPFEVAVPRIYQLLTLASPTLMIALSLDGVLSRVDGILLLGAFLPFVGVVYWLESDAETRFLAAEAVEEATEEDDDDIDLEGPLAVVVPILAVVGMTVGSELAIVGARDLLTAFGIPGLAFGATVVSFVASLEELFLTVEPVRQGVPHLGVGNVIGSTAFFVTANAGVIALVQPIDVSGSVVTVHWPFLLALLVVVVALFARGRVGRPAGAFLLVSYALYWGANYLL